MEIPLKLIQKIFTENDRNTKKKLAIEASDKIIDFLLANRNVSTYTSIKSLLIKMVEYIESFNNTLSPVLNRDVLDGFVKVEKEDEKVADFVFVEKRGNFNEIVGLDSVKKAFEDAIKLPLDHPELFIGNRRPPTGILLYGPPGTGKTYVVSSLLSLHPDLKLIHASSSDLFSKYQGESEKKIKTLFENACASKPCLIFIDEIDFLCKDRNDSSNECSTRIKSELLIRMSEISHTQGVILIGATNLPWDLDPAFIRRFQKRIYMSLPTSEARKEILKFYLDKNRNNLSDEDYDTMAMMTDNFSNSDLKVLSERMLCIAIDDLRSGNAFIKRDGKWELAYNLYEENVINCKFSDIKGEFREPMVTIDHFITALGTCKSSIDVNSLKRYEEWTNKYGEN
ncbi:Vacuolar protein sorting-associated protein 4 [Astathelohania contejeani]|uniref:Vacuolar protein sorting-associated protein 4 n=1 Tax=Astathelohania contejeani TaxID=164912 RepID=A0ABQ7I0U6_9MICR|nr:Vacuolar protein sorting-associated protein 4 [Thelohania contejeani]